MYHSHEARSSYGIIHPHTKTLNSNLSAALDLIPSSTLNSLPPTRWHGLQLRCFCHPKQYTHTVKLQFKLTSESLCTAGALAGAGAFQALQTSILQEKKKTFNSTYYSRAVSEGLYALSSVFLFHL